MDEIEERARFQFIQAVAQDALPGGIQAGEEAVECRGADQIDRQLAVPGHRPFQISAIRHRASHKQADNHERTGLPQVRDRTTGVMRSLQIPQRGDRHPAQTGADTTGDAEPRRAQRDRDHERQQRGIRQVRIHKRQHHKRRRHHGRHLNRQACAQHRQAATSRGRAHHAEQLHTTPSAHRSLLTTPGRQAGSHERTSPSPVFQDSCEISAQTP